jgi:hypothetical protein
MTWQFKPAFNGVVNTLLAVSTNIETEQITNGNLKLKGNGSFWIFPSNMDIYLCAKFRLILAGSTAEIAQKVSFSQNMTLKWQKSDFQDGCLDATK